MYVECADIVMIWIHRCLGSCMLRRLLFVEVGRRRRTGRSLQKVEISMKREGDWRVCSVAEVVGEEEEQEQVEV